LKVLIIIPAFNEEASIGTVVSSIRQNVPEAEILVINDGSTDKTSEKASLAGADVAELPFNLGIGGAMQTGYLYASENSYDIAVQVDADGQHDPRYIKALMQPVIRGEADMCIGSRYMDKTNYKSSFSRRAGMIFFSALVSAITGNSYKDTTSGFRVVNNKIIDYFANTYPVDYPEVDVLVKLHKKGFRICEVPVEMHKRYAGRSSITPIRSIYYMIKVSVSVIIGSLKAADNQ
jgi:glycosyltransferase involved in cell wall biosynthesis